MPLPVKSSSQGNVELVVPDDHVHALVHLPPKSPRLDAALLVFCVVKWNHGPAGETFWHAPSISAAVTSSVQVRVGVPPFGPACIVPEPPRAEGKITGLQV